MVNENMNNNYKLLLGNCIDKLKELPDKSIRCCVTSPPYYGLRDYGTGKWVGGDENCNHTMGSIGNHCSVGTHSKMNEQNIICGNAHLMKSVCTKCGAIRVDEQIGLEETPEEYIQKLVDVFHEVKRVLTDDGTLWVNIGDTYEVKGYNKSSNIDDETSKQHSNKGTWSLNNEGQIYRKGSENLKQKDLIGIPWMLAFALRNDGWYLRQDIIWQKGNCMPESVKDRCTKSHEYIFLLSKNPHYYFNTDAIKEPCVCNENRPSGVVRDREWEYNSKRNNNPEAYLSNKTHNAPRFGGNKYGDNDDSKYAIYSGNEYNYTGFRNKRDVWTINTQPNKEAHFATYPEKLVEPCILAGSEIGDTILDPFNGSGTTGIVAMKNDRKYIGIDLNKDYIELTQKRFDKFNNITEIEIKNDNNEIVKTKAEIIDLW